MMARWLPDRRFSWKLRAAQPWFQMKHCKPKLYVLGSRVGRASWSDHFTAYALSRKEPSQ